MDETVVVAFILGSATLVGIIITNIFLWRLRQVETIAKLVQAHRQIAEDALEAYDRIKKQGSDSLQEQLRDIRRKLDEPF